MDSEISKRQEIVIIQSYKLWELASIYRVSNYVMRKLIARHQKRIGKREGYFYTTEQVAKIFDLIKPPSNVKII